MCTERDLQEIKAQVHSVVLADTDYSQDVCALTCSVCVCVCPSAFRSTFQTQSVPAHADTLSLPLFASAMMGFIV